MRRRRVSAAGRGRLDSTVRSTSCFRSARCRYSGGDGAAIRSCAGAHVKSHANSGTHTKAHADTYAKSNAAPNSTYHTQAEAHAQARTQLEGDLFKHLDRGHRALGDRDRTGSMG